MRRRAPVTESYILKTARVECTFKIAADHADAIDDGQYTLIGAQDPFSTTCAANIWVIGENGGALRRSLGKCRW